VRGCQPTGHLRFDPPPEVHRPLCFNLRYRVNTALLIYLIAV